MLKRFLLAAGASLLAFGAMSTGAAAAGSHHKDPNCSVSPNPAAVGQAYTVTGNGLPTVGQVWLIATAPDGANSSQPVGVDSSGTSRVVTSGSQSGTWTYTFSGLGSGNKYTAVASCSELVT